MEILRIIDGHLELSKKGSGNLVKVETSTGEQDITPEQYWFEVSKGYLKEKGISEKLINDFIDIVTDHVRRTMYDELKSNNN